MAKLKSGTRIYGTATIDTSVVVGSAVTANSSGIQVAGIVTATTFVGALTGTASSTTNIPNLTGAITSNNTTTSLGSFTSAQLATALTDETGSGANVFATSPTLVTPVLGAATATSIVVGSGVTINASGINAAAGIITASQLSTGASGIGVNITTNTISGPATLTIDPAAVGDNTGAVRIKGDLYVDGTQFVVNSTTIELADFNVGIATTVGTNALLDGAGIGIGSTGIRKTITWNNTASALTSSEDWNLASGKQYEINGAQVLSSTTLGSGVVNSSLTSVGTLGQLNVSGVTTATQLDLTANATANDSVLYLSGAPTGSSGTNGLFGIGALNFSDTNIIADFTHSVNSYAQLVVQNKNSGSTSSADIIVNNDRSAGTTYYGDFGINGTTFAGGGPFGDVDGTYLYSAGGTLSLGSLNAFDVKIATNNTERVIIFSTGEVGIGTTVLTGTASQRLQVTGGAYVSGNLGIGITNPSSSLHIAKSTGSALRVTTLTGGGGGNSSILMGNQDSAGTNAPAVIRSANTVIQFGVGNSWSDEYGGTVTERMRIDGNVGINTTSTRQRLTIGSLTATSTATPESIDLGGTYSNSAGTNLKLKLYNDGTLVHGLGVSDASTDYVTVSSGSHTFYRGSTQVVQINSSGNLGINTTSPLQKLHVLGNLLVAAGSSTGQHIAQKAYELNSGTLSWEGSAGQLFSITNNLTSGSIFSVNDVSGIPSIDVNADGTVSIAAYGGNLGIGTTNPTSKLHVQGNARITGKLYDFNNGAGSTGQVLQSIGTGISWTTFSGGATVNNSPSGTYYPTMSSATSGTFSTAFVSSTVLTFVTSTGTLSATAFSGSGANLTSLTAGNLSGTIPSGVLGNSTLYVGTTAILLNRASASQSLTGVNIDGSSASVANAVTFNNGGAGAASGTTFNGSAAQTISYNTLGASPLAGSSSLVTTGTVTSGTWSGSFGAVSGANLTSLNATNLGSGTVPVLRLGSSGTRDATTFLRGDNTWATAGGSITVSDDTSTNATRYLIFEDITSGTSSSINVSSTKLTFNPSTGTLSATVFTSLSDANKKKNIRPIENAIDITKKLEGVRFDWIDTDAPSIGVIAQEVEKVLPELVVENDGVKSVSYGNIVGVLIEAIKEQQVRIEELERKLNA